MDRGGVDFSWFTKSRCPFCGRRGCLRELTPYGRWAVELFPFRKQLVQVARFLCRKTGATVSLLPLELAPYHPVTIPSMLQLLWLCRKLRPEMHPDAVLRTLLEVLPGNDEVTLSLLGCWVDLALRGLQRVHPVLAGRWDLSGIRSGRGLAGGLDQVVAYLEACQVRGPPDLAAGVLGLLAWYSARGDRFLLGSPSQDRRRG